MIATENTEDTEGKCSVAESLRNLEKPKEKAGIVKWNKGKRVEYFGLVAKKLEGKDKLRAKGFVVFDLEDFGIH